MKSQVTTKKGDAGSTSALDGNRYPKHHPIMECVGAIDELHSHIALVRLLVLESSHPDCQALGEFLSWLLHCSFLMGATCSDPLNKHPEYRKGEISPQHLESLETEQMRLEAQVPLPRAFIVSATNVVAAHADIARGVARKAEREFVRLKEQFPDFSGADLLAFLNRLSDYLFILARYLEQGRHETVDYELANQPRTG